MTPGSEAAGSPRPPTGLAGILLAAGASSRFGSPKALVVVGAEPLVRRTLRLLFPRCPSGCVLVTGAAGDAIVAAADMPAVRRAHNPRWAEGMASSLRLGLASLPPTATAALLMPCDLPAVTGHDLDRLVAAWRLRPDDIAAARFDGRAGAPAILPRSVWNDVAISGDRGARDLIASTKRRVLVDMPNAALDVDVPADLERLVRSGMLE